MTDIQLLLLSPTLSDDLAVGGEVLHGEHGGVEEQLLVAGGLVSHVLVFITLLLIIIILHQVLLFLDQRLLSLAQLGDLVELQEMSLAGSKWPEILTKPKLNLK